MLTIIFFSMHALGEYLIEEDPQQTEEISI